MKTVHIHNVLDMLVEAERPLKEEELIEMIVKNFGEDVYFANCSDRLFQKEEVVRFLLSKNKIVINDGMISFNHAAEKC